MQLSLIFLCCQQITPCSYLSSLVHYAKDSPLLQHHLVAKPHCFGNVLSLLEALHVSGVLCCLPKLPYIQGRGCGASWCGLIMRLHRLCPKYSLNNVVCLWVPRIIELLIILGPVQELRIIICEEVMIKTYLKPLLSHSWRWYQTPWNGTRNASQMG